MIHAVEASSPDPELTYKLADGSYIPNKGRKVFKAVTDEGWERKLTTQVTDVDRPLLSVSAIVKGGKRVVFDPRGSFMEDSDGQRIAMEERNGLFTLRMWIPKDQDSRFQGQA